MGIDVGPNQVRLNDGVNKLRGFLSGAGAQTVEGGVAPAAPGAMPLGAEIPIGAAVGPANGMLPGVIPVDVAPAMVGVNAGGQIVQVVHQQPIVQHVLVDAQGNVIARGEQALAGARAAAPGVAGVTGVSGAAVEGGARGQGLLGRLVGSINTNRLHANLGKVQNSLANAGAAAPAVAMAPAAAQVSAAEAGPRVLPGDRILAFLNGHRAGAAAPQVVERGAVPVAERGAGLLALLKNAGASRAAAAAHDAAPAFDLAGVLGRLGGSKKPVAVKAPRLTAGGLSEIFKGAGAAARSAGAARVAAEAAPRSLEGVLKLARTLRIKP